MQPHVALAIRDSATLLIPLLSVLLLIELQLPQPYLTITIIIVVDSIQLPLGNLDPLLWLQLRLHHRSLPREAQLLFVPVYL